MTKALPLALIMEIFILYVRSQKQNHLQKQPHCFPWIWIQLRLLNCDINVGMCNTSPDLTYVSYYHLINQVWVCLSKMFHI